MSADTTTRGLNRHRVMALAGAALFGAAASLLKANKAQAQCGSFVPYPCSGAQNCPASGGVCCPGCTAATDTCGQGQCWFTCAPNGRLYACCDWYAPCGLCICSSCGNCGPGC